MNKLKRTLTGIMAMAAMLSLASCGQKNVDLNSSSNSELIQQMAETSYRAIEIDAMLPFAEVSKIFPVGDTGKLLASGYVETDTGAEIKGFITDMDFSAFEEIDLGIEKAANMECRPNFIAANDGTIYAILTIIDYGDFELPDYNDPDFDFENFDFEAMHEAAVTTYKILTIDESGKVIKESEINGLEEYADSSDSHDTVSIGECFAIGKDAIGLSISSGMDTIYVPIDGDGNLSEPIDFGADKYFSSYGTDRDNNFVYITYDGNNNEIKTVDGATLQLSPDTVSIEDSMYFNTVIKGSGEYRVYLSSSTALYGLKDDGTFTELINWVDSDMTGDYIQGLVPADNGDFILTEQDWSNGTASLYRLTKRDISEIENVQVINMAMEYADHALLGMVKDFNKTNTDYRIKVTDYSEYYEWDEEAEKSTNSPEKQLKQDIAAGKTFDIIALSNASGIFNTLAKKDALVDMYSYLNSDSELTKDDIVPTILSIGEKNGKLVTLTPSFHINTSACKSKFFDKENWTLEEFIETCNNLPEGMKPFNSENTKSSILQKTIMTSNSFIDFENASCDFNSPDFIKLLEFCNQFPNSGEGDEISWENSNGMASDDYYTNMETAVLEERALLYDTYINNPRMYAHLKYGIIGEDFTFVGNPSADGTSAQIFTSATFAIMETSSNKDGCWEFIKNMFSEKTQTSDDFYGFPALKSVFDKKFDEAMEKPYYRDENGDKFEYDDTYYNGKEDIIIAPLTQEERDIIYEYVSNVKANSFYYDEDVYNIVTEEANAYFAGDKTAEETAEIIQNRVSILISEQS